MTQSQVPAFLLDLPSQGIAERTLPHLGGMSPPYVSIQGGRFTLVDASGDSEDVGTHDKEIGVYLDAVIVDSLENESKIYYAKPFDPSSQAFAPPDCWSDNGVSPSRNASNPQGGERRLCAPDPTGKNGCPLAVWGSATSRVSGKGVPACSKYQKIALAIPGGPGEQPDDIVYLLRVPPNSLSNLQTYLAKFKGQTLGPNGPPMGPEHVVTRIWFEKNVLGTLVFRAVNYIDQTMAEFQKKIRADKRTDMLVGRGDQPIAALPAPAVQPPQEQPRPLPASTAQNAAQQQTLPNAPTAAQTAATQSPSEPPANGRRRRRSNTAPAAEPETAPFRPSATVINPGSGYPSGGTVSITPQSANGPAFGVGDPSPMTTELNQSLDSFFGKQ